MTDLREKIRSLWYTKPLDAIIAFVEQDRAELEAELKGATIHTRTLNRLLGDAEDEVNELRQEIAKLEAEERRVKMLCARHILEKDGLRAQFAEAMALIRHIASPDTFDAAHKLCREFIAKTDWKDNV
jgi:phage shock protein A